MVFDAILAAAADLPVASFTDATDIITEGENRGQLLILVTGTVEVVREGVPVAIVDEPGAVFGEMAVLLEAPASATVRTRGDCTFRICDTPDQFLRGTPEVAHAIAQMLARRLDAVTRYLVDVRAQYADREDHLGVMDVVLESLSHYQAAPAEDLGSDREREAPY